MAQTKKSGASSKAAGSKKSKSKGSVSKASTTKKTGKKAPEMAVPPPPPAPPLRREISAVVFLFLSVFLVISHYNSDGSFIVFFSNLVKGLLGWGFWAMVPAFAVAAAVLGFHRGLPVSLRVFCVLFIPVILSAIGHLFMCDMPQPGVDISVITGQLFEQGQYMDCGGVLGGLIAIGLGNSLSLYGALPVLLAALIFCIIKAFKFNVSDAVKKASERAHVKYDPSMYVVNRPMTDDEEAVEPISLGSNEPVRERSGRSAAREPARIERIPRQSFSSMDIPLLDEEDDFDTELFLRDKRFTAVEPVPVGKPGASKPSRSRVEKSAPTAEPSEPVRKKRPAPIYTEKEPVSGEDEARLAGVDVDELRNTVDELMKPVALSTEISDPPKKKISKAEIEKETMAVAAAIDSSDNTGSYEYPPVTLLRSGAAANVDARDEIRINRERLEGAIHSFGINAAIVGVTRGPTVTRYDIELEQGVKLARVTNLAGDLALALGVINVRIAPIPDKISTVGIEVPNKLVSTVYLRDIIDSPQFKNAKSRLSFALGKDISGECIVGNISKLPHMLIAGTTGSGKSVCMNSLILSLLYKATPDEVRLIMIDPKMVELGIYNGIPHLYVPVVTDPKKAAGALQWSVVEMLKRYRLFSEVGVRDLTSYNKLCEARGEPTLPQVVIVIDELADLMLVASKEVEESICRVAQMGRASGMHLVIATQRPSSDVITGLMKANIPSRIAFAVSSALESRIILDQAGAEKLVGMGDMLFSPVGSGKPMRIQGAFVSDEEREDVIQFIKEGAVATEKNDEIEEFMNKASESKDSAEASSKGSRDDSPAGNYDEMLPQAVEAVLEAQSCSVSMLQRRVKLGYSRAARIVDQMEELGIVGPYEGAKPRKVIVDRAAWNELAAQLGYAVDSMDTAAEFSAPEFDEAEDEPF